MGDDDPDGWDWTQPYQPVPVAMPAPPRERSPFAPSRTTKLSLVLTMVVVVTASLVFLFRYELGIANGSYQFLQVQPGTTDVPVTYPSCLPITYVVNDAEAIPGGQVLVDQAVGEISAATGLRFVYLGNTEAAPGRAGAPGATVLIAWTSSGEVPRLQGSTVGVAGSRVVVRRDSGTRYFHTGEVNLDGPDLLELLERDGPEAVRAVIMHELGHVVGLDHVDDRHELMYEANIGRTAFGPGDLRGLARLGKGACEQT